MNILIFGGAGFLGSYVADELTARGHTVRIFDRKPSPWLPAAQSIVGDVLDNNAVEAAMVGAEAVYHFAGIADLNYSIDHPGETMTVNVMGTLNLLEAARCSGVGRFVLASSAYVFSGKGGFYGVSKKACELMLEEYAANFGLDYTVIRYGSVYGERADATNRIHRLLHQALTEGRIDYPGDGSEEREYIHGRDAARLSADILDPEYRNTHVILTGIERLSYRDLLMFVKEIMNNRVKVSFGESDYKGHYVRTPYSFSPTVGIRLVANPCVDFGQGVLECIENLHHQLITGGELDPHPEKGNSQGANPVAAEGQS